MAQQRQSKAAKWAHEPDLKRLCSTRNYDLHYIAFPNAPIGDNSVLDLNKIEGFSHDVLLKEIDGSSILYKKYENCVPLLDKQFAISLEKFAELEGLLIIWHPDDLKANGFNKRKKFRGVHSLYRIPICELSNGERVIKGVWEEFCAYWKILKPAQRYNLLTYWGHSKIADRVKEILIYLTVNKIIDVHIDMEPNSLDD